MFFIFIFQLYILNCVLSASQKSRDDCLFLNKCSTEKLCLLADVMLVSMIMLRIMVSKKSCFQHWKSVLIMQYFSCHSVLNYTTPHDDQNTKWLNFSKCSPVNLIFTLFNFLAKNKLLLVNRKYLSINQRYMNGLETILCNQSMPWLITDRCKQWINIIVELRDDANTTCSNF